MRWTGRSFFFFFSFLFFSNEDFSPVQRTGANKEILITVPSINHGKLPTSSLSQYPFMVSK